MAGVEGLSPVAQRILLNGRAHFLHHAGEEAQVVNGSQPQRQYLPGLEQVADVGTGEVFAGVAVAILVQGVEVLGVAGVFSPPAARHA